MRKLMSILSLVIVSTAFGQSNLTLYNMDALPQSLQVNPGNEIDCQWYFGTPAISSIDFNFNSNGLALRKFNDAFIPNVTGDSFTFDVTQLSSILDKSTFINTGFNVDWINFGFRVGNNLFTANITEKVKTRVSIPGDFFKFVFEGNGGSNLGYQFDFDWGVDVLHTREYAIGYQRSLLNNKLRVGGKLKYVYGLNVVNTERNDLTFTTAEENFYWDVTSDLKVNVASSILSIDSGAEPDPLKAAFGANNNGFGVDFGGSYDLNKKITLSASVIDLGMISWKENTKNVQSRNPGATFQFRGVDIKDAFGDSTSLEEGLEETLDSLLTVFALDTVSQSFTTGLLGEFYLGGNFNLTKRHNAGVLFYGSFYNKQFYPAMTLSWNSKFGRVLSASVSYTAMRGNFTNLGAGLALNGGPEQFYIVSDNIIGTATGNVKNLTVRFGWNHTFGRKKREQKLEDNEGGIFQD
jgi:hypothetical protein